MMPNFRFIEMPLVTRVTSLFLILLLSCMVRSSLADNLPSFVKSPEDQTGVSGEVASFVCQAMGEPKPRITWKKNGKKITFQNLEVIEFNNGSGSVLRIQPLRPHRDEGTYECTATNSAGEINTIAKLTVLEGYQIPQGFPTIDIGPKLRVVEKTRTATMLCAVSGDPDPEISWYKDKLPVDINSSNSRIKQLRSGTLQIENSEESDQGKYECLAMNSVGTRYSAPANLYVRVRGSPPRFSILPTNQEVVPGGSVNLTCLAVGSPMPYVKWMMGTEDLTPEEEMPLGRNVLEVTNIRESASYTCVAMSSLGMIEATAQVTVTGLPSFISFIKSPEDQTGISRGVVSFVCQATGEPKPRITWKRNGKKVSLQRFEVIEFDDGSGSVLRMQPLRTHRDEGIYECIATSSAGETNTSAKLTVLEEDQIPHGFPSFNTNPQLRVVGKSQMAFMHCSASGNPEPEISWYKDMLPVDLNGSNGRIKQLSSGSLQIENSEESDQGKYECVAMNSAGTRYSAPANLYVRELREVRKVPPRFSVPPTNQEVMPGGSVNLTCVAVGSPMPYVKWTLGTKDLAPEDEMPLGRNVLEVTNIRESANFTCVAMSPLGVIEATAQVTVKVPGKPNMMISTMGNTALIQWAPPKEMVDDLIGYQLQYKRADDENFTSLELRRTDDHYMVTGLHKGATYIFRLSARNRAGIGEANTEEISTEKDVPSGFPINLQVTELTQSSTHLTWEPPLLAEKIIYYMVVYRDINRQQNNTILTTDTHVILQCLSPDTTYDIRVQAYTSKGAGPLSPSIQSRTKPNVLLSWLSFLYDIVK